MISSKGSAYGPYLIVFLHEFFHKVRSFLDHARKRLPIMWSCMIEQESLNFMELDHVVTEKVEQLFWDMLSQRGVRRLASRKCFHAANRRTGNAQCRSKSFAAPRAFLHQELSTT
jgi:hypothetical protein